MLSEQEMNTLKQIGKGVAEHFGSNCEVVIHEITDKSAYSSIVAIYNGHVTGRKIGDGPSHVVLEQLGKAGDNPPDHMNYLTRTPNGKILKSSSIYIRDESGNVSAIFCINFDISVYSMFSRTLNEMIEPEDMQQEEPERITLNVTDLLDDLLRQSVKLVGKPVPLMNKADKVKAIQFLNKNGALLITKSGDKIAKYFGISKYTLYSYLDVKQEENKHECKN